MSSRFTETDGIRFRKILRSHQINLELEDQDMTKREVSEDTKARVLKIIKEKKEGVIKEAGGRENLPKFLDKEMKKLRKDGSKGPGN